MFKEVLIRGGCHRHRLAAIHDGTAAHGQNQVNAVFLYQLFSFQHLFAGGVRHNPGEFDDILSRSFQNPRHLIIDAVPEHGTLAVSQQNVVPVGCKGLFEMVADTSLPEIYLCRVFIDETSHIGPPSVLFFSVQYNTKQQPRRAAACICIHNIFFIPPT